MKRLWSAVLFLAVAFLPGLALAGHWDLVKNVKRLERVSPDYEQDKDIDKKFLEILDLTEKTSKEAALYAEAKKVAANPSLGPSKYMDSFLYFMLVKSPGLSRSGTAEVDYWLGMLKAYDKSPHLLPSQLIRIGMAPKNSPDVKRDTLALVEWLKAKTPDFKVRSPEWTGNILLGTKPRSNFAEGGPPTLYRLSLFRAAATPLGGFKEDETYVALLDRLKEGREDLMTEMVAIYRKSGKKKEASEILYQLGTLKASARDFEKAKAALDDAVKLNPENVEAKKLRDRIKLEMTYQSLQPAAPTTPAPEAPAQQPQQQGTSPDAVPLTPAPGTKAP